MNKRLITLLLAAGIAVVFVATALHAGTEVKDTMTMKTDGYKNVKTRHQNLILLNSPIKFMPQIIRFPVVNATMTKMEKRLILKWEMM